MFEWAGLDGGGVTELTTPRGNPDAVARTSGSPVRALCPRQRPPHLTQRPGPTIPMPHAGYHSSNARRSIARSWRVSTWRGGAGVAEVMRVGAENGLTRADLNPNLPASARTRRHQGSRVRSRKRGVVNKRLSTRFIAIEVLVCGGGWGW